MAGRDPKRGLPETPAGLTGSGQIEVLASTLQRLLGDFAKAIDAARVEAAGTLEEARASAQKPHGQSGLADALAALAPAYGQQASREIRLRSKFTTAATLLTVAAVAILLVGCQRALKDDKVDSVVVLIYAIPAGVACIAALFAWWRGERHRRCCREDMRMQNLLRAVRPYTQAMEPGIGNLALALLVPRMFPKSLDDGNPFDDVLWPNAEDVLRLMNSEPETNSGTDED